MEELVNLRTKELKEEKEKSEGLLLNILPKNFQSVSIMFTDFKGFTTISATLPPEELVNIWTSS